MENQESAIATPVIPGALSVNDFCQWAGIGRTAVYAEMKAGRLSARKLGRRTIIPVQEAQRWLGSLPVAHARSH